MIDRMIQSYRLSGEVSDWMTASQFAEILTTLQTDLNIHDMINCRT
jgi:hypothetical protein